MRRRVLAAVGVAVVGLALTAIAMSAPSNDDELLKEEKHFLEQTQKTYDGGNRGGSSLNMIAIGHNNLGGRGFNGDVWVHKGYAYVGHWGFTDWANGSKTLLPAGAEQRRRHHRQPRSDAADRRVSRLQNPAGTSAEDIVVYTAHYGPLAGREIAAAGIQVCSGSRNDASIPRGLMLWDVTKPASPVQLGFLSFGVARAGSTSSRSKIAPTWVRRSSTPPTPPPKSLTALPRRAARATPGAGLSGSSTSRILALPAWHPIGDS